MARTLIITTIFLVMLILALAVLNVSGIGDENGFTELYFVDGVPKTVEVNDRIHFSFAIHNLEDKRVNYSYVIYFDSNKIDEGGASLSHDEAKVISSSFMARGRTGESVPITVQLLNNNQQIRFWIDLR